MVWVGTIRNPVGVVGSSDWEYAGRGPGDHKTEEDTLMIQQGFREKLRAACGSTIALVLGLMVVVARPACAMEHYGGGGSLLDAPDNENTARPILVHHYDCDGELLRGYREPRMIEDGGKVTITTAPRGLTYFTIYTDYLKPDHTSERKAMHFVLGSMNDEGAEAVVYGRIEESDHETALVSLEQGFLWVSSSKPTNWQGAPPNYERADYADPGNPGRPDDPIVGWSLYTLIRSQFTWAGAVATEYIYWIESKARSREQVVLYNLEATVTSHSEHEGGGSFGHTPIKKDEHSRFTRERGIGKGEQTRDRYDQNFVKYVKCRVDRIREHIDGRNTCKDSHDPCAP